MSDQKQVDLNLLAVPFPQKDIDWRIGQAGSREGKVWAKVLAYVDARAVMDRLDDIIGPGGWKDRYWKEAGGTMCGLSVLVNGEWVEKVDGSDDTDIEAFKGGISKALVRTGVKWGVGRYLYNLGDGWAQIVDKSDDARWQGAKTDGKNANQNYPAFYWKPPVLPAWALPPTGAKPDSSPQNQDVGSYSMPIGKFKGMTLEKMGAHGVDQWLSSMVDLLDRDKKKPEGALRDAMNAAEAFLESRSFVRK